MYLPVSTLRSLKKKKEEKTTQETKYQTPPPLKPVKQYKKPTPNNPLGLLLASNIKIWADFDAFFSVLWVP